MVQSSRASWEYSSYLPQAYRSGFNTTHLFFWHEMSDYDYGYEDIYHTYEVVKGNWSIPQILSHMADPIYCVSSTENGIVVYYFNGDVHNRGIWKKEFSELSNLWLREEVIFEESHIIDYLSFSEQESEEFSFWVHAFHKMTDGSYYVVWSFDFYHRSNFVHPYEETYIVSQINNNGTMISQVLQDQKEYRPLRGLTLINVTGQLFLYSRDYGERTVLLPNGTWSSWQNSSVVKPESTGENLYHEYIYLEGFLIYSGENRSKYGILGLIDLTKEVPLFSEITTPYKLNITTYQLGLALEQHDELIIDLALINDNMLELWQYRNDSELWIQIASLTYEFNISYYGFLNYRGLLDYFLLDLLREGPYWYVFWDQNVYARLYEVFGVSYNSVTDEWSSITRITDTNKITDDHGGGVFPGLTFPFVLIGLCCFFVFLRKRNC